MCVRFIFYVLVVYLQWRTHKWHLANTHCPALCRVFSNFAYVFFVASITWRVHRYTRLYIYIFFRFKNFPSYL